jgi:uncharacterized protein
VTESVAPTVDRFAVTDPTTTPWWRAAGEGRLLVQCCDACGAHQLYPRPFCLRCESRNVAWVASRGTGRVYSQTTVHVSVVSWLTPPYVVALVELDEGPRLLTNLVGPPCRIGDRVEVCWDVRDDLVVPLFTVCDERIHDDER